MTNEAHKYDAKRIQMLRDAVRDLRIAHSAIHLYQTNLTNSDVNNLRDVYSACLDAERTSAKFLDEYKGDKSDE